MENQPPVKKNRNTAWIIPVLTIIGFIAQFIGMLSSVKAEKGVEVASTIMNVCIHLSNFCILVYSVEFIISRLTVKDPDTQQPQRDIGDWLAVSQITIYTLCILFLNFVSLFHSNNIIGSL